MLLDEEAQVFPLTTKLLSLVKRSEPASGVRQLCVKLPLMQGAGTTVEFHIRVLDELIQALVLELHSIPTGRPTKTQEEEFFRLCEEVISEVMQDCHPLLEFRPLSHTGPPTGQYVSAQLWIHELANTHLGYMVLFCDESQVYFQGKPVFETIRSEAVYCSRERGAYRWISLQ